MMSEKTSLTLSKINSLAHYANMHDVPGLIGQLFMFNVKRGYQNVVQMTNIIGY